jgi:hypothetical protein
VTGFDWSVQAWEMRWDCVFRCKQAGTKSTSWYSRAVMARIESLIGAVLMLSDGRLFQPTIPGIQLSGSNNTSSTNSRIRTFLALLIGARWALTNGDDAVEDHVLGAVDRYAELGHFLRFYTTSSKDEIDFCSHQYSRDTVVPNNYKKAIFNLLSRDMVPVAHLQQFRHYVRHVPNLGDEVTEYLQSQEMVCGSLD